MKILITGAAGLCGKAIAPLLNQHHGYEIITSDIRDPENNFPFIHCDIRNPEDVEEMIKGKNIDFIIHLGTLQPGLGPSYM
ncbi:NAD-dependent epimerase/dehydratase family protein, partial [Candidatus Poribacteria bacterium]|nr:NAD-dependent epimerase/dehydratase family protein [Candidatus Poribacteria bacterium]